MRYTIKDLYEIILGELYMSNKTKPLIIKALFKELKIKPSKLKEKELMSVPKTQLIHTLDKIITTKNNKSIKLTVCRNGTCKLYTEPIGNTACPICGIMGMMKQVLKG